MDDFKEIDLEITNEYLHGSNISNFLEKLLMKTPDELERYINRLCAISYREGFIACMYDGDYREDIL